MGVQGLQTIVNNLRGNRPSTVLKNTKLVIDGDNLVYFIYERKNIDLKHGGDYDDFAKAIKLFFSHLLENNIDPYVVMDGGYETDYRKHETTIQRSRDRITKAVIACNYGTNTFAPMLARSVFLNILEEMTVSFVVCDFDADHEIVVLANKFNCPVLSRDSDFFIYDITEGYIPLDSFELCKNHCTCKIYHRKKIAKKLKIKVSALPVLAISLGNDYVRRKYLYHFYKTLPWRESDGSTLSSVQRKVVTWLKKTKVVDALHQLKTIFPNLITNIQLSYDMYRQIDEFDSFDLLQYLPFKKTEIHSKFDDLHRRGKMPVCIKNARLLQRLFLLTQVEDVNRRSIHRCSKRLRTAMYGLLSTGPVFEYDRYVDRYRIFLVRFRVPPLDMFDDFQPLPNLKTVLEMNVQDKIDFLCNVFRFTNKDKLCGFPENMKLLILIMLYWMKHAKPYVNSCFLEYVLFCHFRLLAISGLATASLSIPKLQQDDLDHFIKQTERFCISYDAPDDIRIIHGFSQFQTCLEFGNNINQLLEYPVPCIKPHLVFKGSFLNNMYTQVMIHNHGKVEGNLEEETDKILQPAFLENCPFKRVYREIKALVKFDVCDSRWQVKYPKKTSCVRMNGTISRVIPPRFAMFNRLGLDDVEA